MNRYIRNGNIKNNLFSCIGNISVRSKKLT